MKKTIDYNGPSPKARFYKIKKHWQILRTRVKSSSELKRIRSYQNDTLSTILDAFLQVKHQNFGKEDVQAFERQEAFRSGLLRDESIVTYEIFDSSAKRSVKDICRVSASPKVWAQFLYCLAKKLQSRNVLEIGTNVGISGAYLLEALKSIPGSRLVTMEGLSQLCDIAEKQFLNIVDEEGFEVIPGLYQNTFPKILESDRNYDLLFIDGNHQKEPTIEYFEKLKAKITSPAVYIFDDINYSIGMHEAWEIIRMDADVNYSIDLFKNGIVIIDSADANRNENFSLHLDY